MGTLVSAANHSLALSTWKSYNTAENHLAKCQADTGVVFSLPMDDKMTLTYVGWLLNVRKVSSASVDQYLSGLRNYHMKHLKTPDNLRPEIVKAIIKVMLLN